MNQMFTFLELALALSLLMYYPFGLRAGRHAFEAAPPDKRLMQFASLLDRPLPNIYEDHDDPMHLQELVAMWSNDTRTHRQLQLAERMKMSREDRSGALKHETSTLTDSEYMKKTGMSKNEVYSLLHNFDVEVEKAKATVPRTVPGFYLGLPPPPRDAYNLGHSNSPAWINVKVDEKAVPVKVPIKQVVDKKAALAKAVPKKVPMKQVVDAKAVPVKVPIKQAKTEQQLPNFVGRTVSYDKDGTPWTWHNQGWICYMEGAWRWPGGQAVSKSSSAAAATGSSSSSSGAAATGSSSSATPGGSAAAPSSSSERKVFQYPGMGVAHYKFQPAKDDVVGQRLRKVLDKKNERNKARVQRKMAEKAQEALKEDKQAPVHKVVKGMGNPTSSSSAESVQWTMEIGGNRYHRRRVNSRRCNSRRMGMG